MTTINPSPGEQVVSAFSEVVRQGMGGKTTAYGTQIYDSEALGEVVTLAGAPRKNISIRQALPWVALEQVKALHPDADLDDSADWYFIQSLITECAEKKIKAIKIPRGTYHLTRGIDFSELGAPTFLDAEGVTLKATRPMPYMALLEHRGNWLKSHRFHLRGIELEGAYLAEVGLKIAEAQEWEIDAVVRECHVGIALSDVWYGEFSTSTIIRNCLVGVAFDAGHSTEINTIEIANLKINFSRGYETHFKNVENTDTIGIRVSTVLGGIDLHTCVVEGVDYGIKYVPQKKGRGALRGLFSITGCYWEAIGKSLFDFSDIALPGYMHCYNSMIIRGNRVHTNGNKESVFGPGEIEIIGNQPMKVRMMRSIPNRAMLRIDDQVELIEPPTGHQIFVDRTSAIPVNVDTQRFSSWGKVGQWPEGEAMMRTVEHAAYRTAPPAQLLRRTGGHSKMYPVHSITSRPTVYYPGHDDTPNGPVVRGSDGGWYMILAGDGGALTTRQVHNIARLDEGVDSRTAEQLHHMTSGETVGVKYRCIDTNTDMILGERDGQKRWVDRAGHLTIGTTTELLTELPTIPNGGRVFDTTTKQAAWSDGRDLYIYDWWGEQTRNPLTSTT